MYPHHTEWPEGAEFGVIDSNGYTYFSNVRPERYAESWIIFSDSDENSWFSMGEMPRRDITTINWRETLRSKQQQKEIDMENARKDFDESANFDVVSDIDAVIDGIGKEYDKRLIDLTKERTRVLQIARRLHKEEQEKDNQVFKAIKDAVPDAEDFKRISTTQIEIVGLLYDAGWLRDPSEVDK